MKWPWQNRWIPPVNVWIALPTQRVIALEAGRMLELRYPEEYEVRFLYQSRRGRWVR